MPLITLGELRRLLISGIVAAEGGYETHQLGAVDRVQLVVPALGLVVVVAVVLRVVRRRSTR